MNAYVVINCEKGQEEHVFDKIQQFDETINAHIIFGAWDIIAKVEVDSPEALTGFIIDKLRKIEGVELTSTYIIAR